MATTGFLQGAASRLHDSAELSVLLGHKLQTHSITSLGCVPCRVHALPHPGIIPAAEKQLYQEKRLGRESWEKKPPKKTSSELHPDIRIENPDVFLCTSGA